MENKKITGSEQGHLCHQEATIAGKQKSSATKSAYYNSSPRDQTAISSPSSKHPGY
jgi:hypothetical protein